MYIDSTAYINDEYTLILDLLKGVLLILQYISRYTNLRI